MGRPLRLKAQDVTYHISSRTNGKRILIKKRKDQKALCRCLQSVKLKYNAKIYGFTPMGNHFHLVLKVVAGTDLSKFMCEFKTAYAKYYNTKYNQSGHFWGERFQSMIIQDDKHLLACLRYIDRNPVKAGLVQSPEEWCLGSYRFYAYGIQHRILTLEWHPTYLAVSEESSKRQQFYCDYVLHDDQLSDGLHGTLGKRQVFGERDVADRF